MERSLGCPMHLSGRGRSDAQHRLQTREDPTPPRATQSRPGPVALLPAGVTPERAQSRSRSAAPDGAQVPAESNSSPATSSTTSPTGSCTREPGLRQRLPIGTPVGEVEVAAVAEWRADGVSLSTPARSARWRRLLNGRSPIRPLPSSPAESQPPPTLTRPGPTAAQTRCFRH